MSARQSREPYPVATMVRARELREAGWFPTAIRRLLEKEGHGSPSLFTIQTWTNPRYLAAHHERMQARGLERSAERSRFRLQGSSESYRRAFMERLRDEGVSCNGIAKVCRVVFGVPLTAHQVRYALTEHDALRADS
jgi:hypothetical protein